MSFKVNNIPDLELIYSLLREKHPKNKIDITYNYNLKEYFIKLSDELFQNNPEIPIDVDIEVIYGDSVTSDTPILLRNRETNQVYIKTIDSINDNWVDYPEFKIFDKTVRLDKSYATTDLQVWCDLGWTDIKKIIRHKTNKKIYRVLTHTGCVDVTEDHSLMTDNFEKIKPTEVKVGDLLAHSFPTVFTENEQTIVKMKKEIIKTKKCKNCGIVKDVNEFYKQNTSKDGRTSKCRDCDYYSKNEHTLRNVQKNFTYNDYVLTNDEAEVWGFFYAEGSSGCYKCKSGVKNSWALNSQNMELLNYYKDILENIEPVTFKILDTLKSSGVYKLVPQKSLKHMVEKYRPLFYDTFDCNAVGDKYKIIPNIILNASKEIKKSFWIGYCKGDGSKTHGYDVDNPRFCNKGKIGSQCLYYLMKSIGYNMNINTRLDPKKQEIYTQTYIKGNIRKNEKEIKKIIHFRDSTLEEYVYDIETECGRFNAGIGKMVIKNTDSIFIKFKYNLDDYEKNRKDTFELATLCGNKITNELFNRPPIELEFEKIFQPFILLTKKRYIANKYDNPKKPFELKGVDSKGIATKRRDYCKYVQNCYQEIIDSVMLDYSVDGLKRNIEIFKKYIKNIETYNVNIDDLVVSSLLAKKYKTTPVHVILAEKLKERHEEVQVGTRIPYIYIESDDPKKAKSELGEDPDYAKKNNLKFNRGCYLEQMSKPILSFFSVILHDDQKLLNDILDYTNEKLIQWGRKKLKHSDLKIDVPTGDN